MYLFPHDPLGGCLAGKLNLLPAQWLFLTGTMTKKMHDPRPQLVKLLTEGRHWQGELHLQRGDVLKPAGSVEQRLFLVTKGCLRAYLFEEGEEKTIRFGYKNSLITAIDSLASGAASPLCIEALRQTTVCFISKLAYQKALTSTAEGTQLLLEAMLHLSHGQLERERDLLTASPAARYQRVLKRSPQLFQEVPNKYIASYLRMTPETLSRIKKVQ